MRPQDYAALGWRVLPTLAATKRGLVPHTEASNDPDAVARWSTRYPNAGWAVVCGPESGILALDVDGEAGTEALASCAARSGAEGHIRRCPTVLSGSGRWSWHLYLRWPDGAEVRNGYLAPSLEVRGRNLLLMLPPSRHPDTKAPYRWLDGHGPDVALPAPPGWLLDAMRPKPAPTVAVDPVEYSDKGVQTCIERRLDEIRGAAKGSRNHVLYCKARAALWWAQQGRAPTGRIAGDLLGAATACGLSYREAWPTIVSAAKSRGLGL